MLGAAGDLDDALGREVLDLGGRGLVAEGAAAQLPGAVAAPAVHAALRHRRRVRPARRHRPHILHACASCECHWQSIGYREAADMYTVRSIIAALCAPPAATALSFARMHHISADCS